MLALVRNAKGTWFTLRLFEENTSLRQGKYRVDLEEFEYEMVVRYPEFKVITLYKIRNEAQVTRTYVAVRLPFLRSGDRVLDEVYAAGAKLDNEDRQQLVSALFSYYLGC